MTAQTYGDLETLEDVRRFYGIDQDADAIPFPSPMSGQPLWVAIMEQHASSDGDILNRPEGSFAATLPVSDEDRERFDFDPDTVAVLIESDSQGFITGTELTADDLTQVETESGDMLKHCPSCGDPTGYECNMEVCPAGGHHDWHCPRCLGVWDNGGMFWEYDTDDATEALIAYAHLLRRVSINPADVNMAEFTEVTLAVGQQGIVAADILEYAVNLYTANE